MQRYCSPHDEGVLAVSSTSSGRQFCESPRTIRAKAVITCPKYLKTLTNCRKLPAIENCGNDTFIILALSFGSNIIQTDFLALQIMSILAICCSRTVSSFVGFSRKELLKQHRPRVKWQVRCSDVKCGAVLISCLISPALHKTPC